MADDLTHASFFSGVGGLDMGLERAGWRTVSFSEIDPYASAVLAERWPGVPNLGDITQLADVGASRDGGHGPEPDDRRELDGRTSRLIGGADLWTGGFPCQDLSVAGKRRGMGEGTRSGLAYAYLDLVGRHRPRFVLLENVPGLLSSHGGRDMAALLGALVELGYGVGYRMLDARYFGVPQRRRRVFILGDSLGGRAGAERASEVLSVGSRCRRHPPAGIEAGPGVAYRARPGVDIARAVTGTSGKRHDDDTDTLIANAVSASAGHHGHGSPRGDGSDNLVTSGLSCPRCGHWWDHHDLGPCDFDGFDIDDDRTTCECPGPAHDAGGQGRRGQGAAALRGHEPDAGNLPDADVVRWAERETPDARGDGAPDGLAGRSYDRGGVVNALDQRHDGADDNEAQAGQLVVSPTLLAPTDGGRRDKVPLAMGDMRDFWPLAAAGPDPLLPLGLDSHRYRCCGNGVVSDVAEWIGARLAAVA